MADNYVAAPVVNGKPVTGTSETYQGKKSKGDELGKDAFLQLLVAQMQNQDPLEPTDNSQMVAQLAQFTTIEELQNLGTTLNNMNAFGLIGKAVILEVGKSTDATTTTTVGGYVDYVKIEDGKAKLSIKGELYDYDDLDMVVDQEYLDYIFGKPDGDDSTGDATETPDGDGSTGDTTETPDDKGDSDNSTEKN